MLRVVKRRKRTAYPKLSSGGPRLLVLERVVNVFARVRAKRAPPALRAATIRLDETVDGPQVWLESGLLGGHRPESWNVCRHQFVP